MTTDMGMVLTWKHPTVRWSVSDNVVIDSEGGIPSAETLKTWTDEYEAAKSWMDLREERNLRLAKSDWMANSDVTMSDAWKTYRQELRDLPSTLNDTTVQQTITWPDEPS